MLATFDAQKHNTAFDIFFSVQELIRNQITLHSKIIGLLTIKLFFNEANCASPFEFGSLYKLASSWARYLNVSIIGNLTLYFCHHSFHLQVIKPPS